MLGIDKILYSLDVPHSQLIMYLMGKEFVRWPRKMQDNPSYRQMNSVSFTKITRTILLIVGS